MNVTFIRSNAVDPDSRVEKEVNSLCNLGYSIAIFAWDRIQNYKVKENYIMLQNRKVPIFRIGIKATFGGGLTNFIPLIKFQIQILKYLFQNKKNIDIIHACDFDTALASFLFAKLFRKKFVYDIFDYYVEAFSVPQKLKFVIELLDKIIINNSDAVIITNEARRKQIEHTSPKKLYIIHNTPNNLFEINPNKLLTKKENNLFKIVYVGILGENRFLKEMCEVIKENKKWELYIGGFGELENSIAEYSKENENIYFLGKLPYSDVISLEKEADLLVAIYNPEIPNHRYSSPNKLYEALMLGKPIIVAQNTGIDTFVEKEQIGIAIPYCKEQFKNCLQRLEKDLIFKKQNIEIKCKQLYHTHYSWDIMEKKLEDLYANLI
ncbi:glycosyltransferase family 4 protein [Turicibacter bilis]|uniref:glycosyltransferase family 4 protein n=1 Tax=Turicibacter bilis TaxID=2735723 RepID=UPI003F8A8E0B